MKATHYSKLSILDECMKNINFHPDAIISICNPDAIDKDELKKTLEKITDNFLQLEFYDMEYYENKGEGIFSREQAEQIIDLIESLPVNAEIAVHCDGGISRSAAVAAYINLWANNSDEIFCNYNYGPNETVLMILNDVAGNVVSPFVLKEYCYLNERLWRLESGQK